MKIPSASFPELYARWKRASWPLLTGRPGPSSEIPKPAQVAADQQWEGEGGSVKPAPKAPR
jgi:hypothetical protein